MLPLSGPRRQTWEQSHLGGGHLYNLPPRPAIKIEHKNVKLQSLLLPHVKIVSHPYSDLLLHWKLTSSPLKIKIMSVLFFEWCLIKHLPNYNTIIYTSKRFNFRLLDQRIPRHNCYSYHALLQICGPHTKISQPPAGVYFFHRRLCERHPDCISQTILHMKLVI